MWKHPLTWVGFFLLGAVVAVWDYSPEDLLREPPEAQTRFPQIYMTGSETRRYNTDGALYHQLRSERAEHYREHPDRSGDGDHTLIEAPDVTAYSDDSAPWRLTARRGRSDAQGEQIELTDQVHAWQNRGDGRTDLTTDWLLVEPDRQYARTDKPVKMRSPQGQHEAIGLRARLNEDHIELLSEVRGVYESPEEN